MQTRIYYLESRSPFHLGERGVGLEATSVMAHADTLFSALCATCREWYGLETLDTLLQAYLSAPPFLLSSAFPYVALGDSKVIRLYPRPRSLPPGQSAGDDYEALGRAKKAEWISEEIFLSWVSGQPIDAPGLLHGGKIWVTPGETEELNRTWNWRDSDNNLLLWATDQVPRVTVDRAANASAVYRAGRVRFAPGSGLWVAFQWHAEDWQPYVEELLHVLGDSGLGGERSAGHGQFRVWEGDALDLPDPSSRFVTLAPYWPQQDEVAVALDVGSAYTLLMRRGWMGSPDGSALRRKSVRMVGEGSVLNMPARATPGGLADVTPDVFEAHGVYRYGYAFPVGMEAV